MTNQERITSHNNRLEAMKETVAGLPDAGTGGGGAVETCTVNLTIANNDMPDSAIINYITVDNGVVTYSNISCDSPGSITFNSIKGSFVLITTSFNENLLPNSLTISDGGEYVAWYYGEPNTMVVFLGTSSDVIDISFAVYG